MVRGVWCMGMDAVYDAACSVWYLVHRASYVAVELQLPGSLSTWFANATVACSALRAIHGSLLRPRELYASTSAPLTRIC